MHHRDKTLIQIQIKPSRAPILPVSKWLFGALIVILSVPSELWMQTAPKQPAPPKVQQGGTGGIAGGIGAAPVYDEQRGPITAGGFVDKGPVIFEDITKQAGLAGWRHKMGGPEKDFIVEANGSGVFLIDYDNDG